MLVCVYCCGLFFFFKQKTAYEIYQCDWSSDGCSSDLDRSVHTFSIHNRTLLDVEAVEDTCIELGTGVDDGLYLETLRRELPPLVERLQPELVFYLAGADVARDDRHGDWNISADAILERDRFVMETLRPPGSERAVVVLLAGGYGNNAWRYSARFCSWLVLGRSLEPPATEDLPLAMWRKLTARLSEPDPGLWTGSLELGADQARTACDGHQYQHASENKPTHDGTPGSEEKIRRRLPYRIYYTTPGSEQADTR